MSEFRLRGDPGHELTLILLEQGQPHLPSAGDIKLSIRVECADFGGERATWISRGEWQRFLAEIDALERSRRGSATLEAMSPGALRLALLAQELGSLLLEGDLGTPHASLRFQFPIAGEHVAQLRALHTWAT